MPDDEFDYTSAAVAAVLFAIVICVPILVCSTQDNKNVGTYEITMLESYMAVRPVISLSVSEAMSDGKMTVGEYREIADEYEELRLRDQSDDLEARLNELKDKSRELEDRLLKLSSVHP